VLESRETGLALPANVTLCLQHGGFDALERGRRCARLQPLLNYVGTTDGDGQWLPIDFAKVLGEPVVGRPRAAAPPPADAPPPPAPEAPCPPRADALAIPPGSARALEMARSGLDPYALEPTDLQAAMYLAGEVFASKMYPKMPNPAAVLTLMGRARCLGIPAFMAGDYFDYVQGRLAWRAQGLLAVVKSHRTCRRLEFDWPRCSDVQAVVLFQRNGEKAGEYVFTIGMAQAARFLDGKHSEQWKLRPGVMLRWAAVRELIRAVWPDVVGGLSDDMGRGDPDELVAEPELS
jgi:hypothetical protein